jgi:hypothetical protein
MVPQLWALQHGPRFGGDAKSRGMEGSGSDSCACLVLVDAFLTFQGVQKCPRRAPCGHARQCFSDRVVAQGCSAFVGEVQDQGHEVSVIGGATEPRWMISMATMRPR